MADTILFLVSDEASFITGVIILNDNGFSINHDLNFTHTINQDVKTVQKVTIKLNVKNLETKEEKRARISFQNALKSNNNEYVFEKIESKISSFCSKLKILQDYSLCLGSKLYQN